MDEQEINAKIIQLENGATNWETCEKLHVLYGVKNGITKREETVARMADMTTEFEEAFNAAPRERAMEVLNEHFNAVATIYPKEYNLILKKLKGV